MWQWKLATVKSLKEQLQTVIKDTHREKAPSNKTPALLKIMNMDIWIVSNQIGPDKRFLNWD